MVAVTDEQMQARLKEVRAFTTVFLKKGAAYVPPELRPAEQAAIVLEHGRRNMSLSAEGKLAIVGPIAGGGDIVGLCIFCLPEDEVRAIMEGDGAVRAGIFIYEIVTLYGFPGDRLPKT